MATDHIPQGQAGHLNDLDRLISLPCRCCITRSRRYLKQHMAEMAMAGRNTPRLV
ncbi:MAG: hypothetical protein K2X00_05990 [Nitrospiraceae bacterium]|nr:hypothetical protein [Nitrospiraceae bacterium]